MESTSIDFISFWLTASSMLALRLCTLKSLTKIGRLISATSSGRTPVNFETKVVAIRLRRFSHEFLRACEHGAEALCRIAIGPEPALLGKHRGDVHVRDVFLVRIADHANIAGLLQDREERLHRPHRIQPVLYQRIGHLRERNFGELNGLRIAAVSPHPFNEMDVVDAVEKPDRGALARKISRLLNGTVGFYHYRRIVRRFGPDARTRHDQHHVQAVAARDHRFQHAAAGEFHATAIGRFNGNRRLRHWRPGDVEPLLLEPTLVAAHKKPRVIGDRSHHDAYRREHLLRKGRCPAGGERKCGGTRYESPSSLAHPTLLSFARNQRVAARLFSAATSYPEASIEPAPIHPHTSTTSAFEVLLKPCQHLRGE
jgi:hypothetical protein